jgi:alpha-tubulin suppressor-like RCC1 family protein
VSAVVGLDTGVAAVEAGSMFSCALLAAGTVSCWGANDSLQSGGVVPTMSYSTPHAIPGVTGAIALGVGQAHGCAVITNVITGDTVKCWGENEDGQLGDGTVMDRAGAGAVIGLTDVVEVAPGGRYTCARTDGGGVKCWGANSSGQLGDGSTTPRPQPVDVLGLTSGVAQVVAGAGHTCALVTGGEVRCWGNNVFGQLGDGTVMERHQPVTVTLAGPATELTAGAFHTCALLASGALHCWGLDEVGQVGDDGRWGYGNSPVPLAVPL